VKLTAAILLSLAVFWVVGLFTFAGMVDRSTPPAPPPAADGVVALTGASNARISAAMRLLEAGKAKRMLVSGVNPETTRADMRGVAGAERRIYDCCVDLGYQATDTFGNARETAHWASSNDYGSLILVTSDFHMPRALLALKAALPAAVVYPYPIRTAELDSKHWWRRTDSIRRMVTEYSKFLIILAQTSLQSLHLGRHAGSEPPAASDAPAAASAAAG
jgi:uncharacterized SAM-binding protein YcdF (DUF218 family)